MVVEQEDEIGAHVYGRESGMIQTCSLDTGGGITTSWLKALSRIDAEFMVQIPQHRRKRELEKAPPSLQQVSAFWFR